MAPLIFFYQLKEMRTLTAHVLCLLLVILPFSSGKPAECNYYKSLSGVDRATSYNRTRTVQCDRSLSPGWYRMTGEAGDHIPEKCVPKNHCGTHAPGWLNGKHPTVQEGLVTRRVCYHWSSSCCHWKNYIKIRNCGDYFVYHLSTSPTCYLRYCGEGNAHLFKTFQVQLTCNGELSFYDRHIGKLVVSTNPANISSNYTVDSGSQVVALAVSCHNKKSKPWIMGSVSNGLVTDTRWKCTSLPEGAVINSLTWTTPLFDDTHWAQAVTNISNRGESPWGQVPDINDDAFWISTAEEDSRLFCRRRLSDRDMSFKRGKSNGIFQATLDDVDHALSSRSRSQHEVSDVMQCFQKCRDDSHCLSFNFEYTSVLPTKKCELNDLTKGQDPKSYVKRPGYTYYENVG